ncbi:MAG: hypothetical protein V4484_21970 [Pseudomonadota bacterium]
MIRSSNRRSRRLRKKLHIGEFQNWAYLTDHAIATRSLVFTFDHGRTEEFHVYIWEPHRVAEQHWRCPYLIQGDSFEGGSYCPGADSMQALVLATHSISSYLAWLARSHNGVFTLDGSTDLGFPDFGDVEPENMKL